MLLLHWTVGHKLRAHFLWGAQKKIKDLICHTTNQIIQEIYDIFLAFKKQENMYQYFYMCIDKKNMDHLDAAVIDYIYNVSRPTRPSALFSTVLDRHLESYCC